MTKYIITDPCYILPNTTWSDICDQCESNDFYNGKFDRLCTEALNELAGTTNAVASTTGYGDWSNSMHCSNDDKIIQSDFFADSGMVCVVEYNDKIQQALKDNKNEKLVDEDKGGAALIETEGEVKITMDTRDSEWTVVEIEDEHDGFNSMLPVDDDEEEDE